MARITRLPRAERREQILASARQVIAREGVAALTMERAAQTSGISKPVLYDHFDNRSALLQALLESYWAYLDDQIRARLQEVDRNDLHASVDAFIAGYFDAIASGGPVLHVLISAESHDPAVDQLRREFQHRAEQEWAAIYRQKANLDRQSAAIVAAALRGVLDSVSGLLLRMPDVEKDTCIRVCQAIFHAALQRPS